ncbi:MAG TPA: AbrB/MazE/SpoVT family DNA-binding domain-containing protein [archaeon]|nr:AbrB/MazE/SpoVT family DNA-binding domain-containing protein [archaeon]
MNTVKLSSKFQIVIPREIRNDMGLRPGEKMIVIEKGGTIHLVPAGRIKDAKGIARGVSSRNVRDEYERFD